MDTIYMDAFIGGIIIGISVVILLLFSGRVAGNSGIIAGMFRVTSGQAFWKFFYFLGLLCGGIIYLKTRVSPDTIALNTEPITIFVAGLLVGFGTRLGSGCTSGHGICGMSRLSVRSIVATCVFMASAMLTVFIVGFAGGTP